MNDLRENKEVNELLETLEKNGMEKEKTEVNALVDYIGDMEKTLTVMLSELKEMRKEVNLIHDSSLRSKCGALVQNADSKIHQGISVIGRAKDNIIKSAKNAIAEFKAKGKEALKSAVKAMKIAETLDNFGKFFGKMANDMRMDVQKYESARMEYSASKQHRSNARMLLLGMIPKDTASAKNDKGILARLQIFCGKLARGFSGLETKTNELADKLRFDRVKTSVKADLDFLNGKTIGSSISTPNLDAR